MLIGVPSLPWGEAYAPLCAGEGLWESSEDSSNFSLSPEESLRWDVF